MQASVLFLAVIGTCAHECPPANFSSIESFDLDTFISARWYIQEQMPVSYLPESQNYCVYAEYEKKNEPSFPWGYQISVNNHAENVMPPHTVHEGLLCAKIA